MKEYHITVFDGTGQKLLDETFEAENDTQAKQKGWEQLEDNNFTNYPYRVVSPLGHLILFKNDVYKGGQTDGVQN